MTVTISYLTDNELRKAFFFASPPAGCVVVVGSTGAVDKGTKGLLRVQLSWTAGAGARGHLPSFALFFEGHWQMLRN